MNKEITEIVVKVNNVDEYNKLYRTMNYTPAKDCCVSTPQVQCNHSL